MYPTVSFIQFFYFNFILFYLQITKDDLSESDAIDDCTVLETSEKQTEETGEETLASQMDQSELTTLTASRDMRKTPRKRISLKRGQKRWDGLKKRRKSLADGKKEKETNRTRKMLAFQKSTAEGTSCSEGIYLNASRVSTAHVNLFARSQLESLVKSKSYHAISNVI